MKVASRRKSNVDVAAAVVRLDQEWEVYDSMPHEVKMLLGKAPANYSAQQVLQCGVENRLTWPQLVQVMISVFRREYPQWAPEADSVVRRLRPTASLIAARKRTTMKTTVAAVLAAGAMALWGAAAQANPCTGTNVQNCNAGGNQTINSPSQAQAQGQQQYLNNSNKAYGGAGGAGGQGGAGGNGYGGNQSQSNTNTVTSSNNNSNANSATANNEGNSQNVNIDSGTKQVGAIAVALAASGPCTGAAGGAAIGTYPLTLGFNYISESDKCNQRELIRISQASTNPQIRARADAALLSMFDAEFGKPASSGQQQGSVSAVPAAIAPQQTASVAANPSCLGANTHTNWYVNNCTN